MENSITAPNTASSLPAGKITRKQLAVHFSLSLRYIDELTRNGTLPYFRIGKSIRYDVAEVDAVLRERFHVQPKLKKPHTTGTRAFSPAA